MRTAAISVLVQGLERRFEGKFFRGGVFRSFVVRNLWCQNIHRRVDLVAGNSEAGLMMFVCINLTSRV